MPPLNELFKKKGSILENSEKVFYSKIEGLEKSIYKNILRLLTRFSVRNGKFNNNKKNRKLLANLDRLLLSIFSKSPLSSEMGKYLVQFDDVEKLNKEIYNKILTKEERKTLTEAFEKTQPEKARVIKDVTEGLTNPAIVTANIIKPIRDSLMESVIFKRTFDEAEELLRNEIVSTGDTNSRLLRYTKQLTRDAINHADGAVQDIMREEYKLDGMQYVGSLKKTSRQNCIDLIRGSGTFKDLALSPRKYKVEDLPKIVSRASVGDGWNPACTAETFGKYRCGYNCRHRVAYFRILPSDLK